MCVCKWGGEQGGVGGVEGVECDEMHVYVYVSASG